MKMILIIWMIFGDGVSVQDIVFDTPEACMTARKDVIDSQKTSRYGSVEVHALCEPQQ